MFITRKEVEEKTICTRGTGFSPRWKYEVNLGPKGHEYYSKSYVSDEVEYRGQGRIGHAYNKGDFAELVKNHYNETQDVSVVQKDKMEWGFVFLLANDEEVLIARVENEDDEQWDYKGSNETFDTPEDALDDYITSFTG